MLKKPVKITKPILIKRFKDLKKKKKFNPLR